MFKILIVDDDKTQYENIRAKLLTIKTNNFDAMLKDDLIKHFLHIDYFSVPSEAEVFIEKVAGTRNEPNVVICDVNFEGLPKASDNGAKRGLDIASKVVQTMPNVPIFIVTFYSINEIFNEMMELIPKRHYARWLYTIPKEKVLDSIWTRNFNGLLQFLVAENIGDIVIPQKEKKRISNALSKNEKPDLNIKVTYKKRNWNLEKLLLGFLTFENNGATNLWNYGLNIELKNILESLVGVTNKEREMLFTTLKSDYENHLLHAVWKTEIREKVKAAIIDFMAYDWAEEKPQSFVPETYFAIGQKLDMNRLPIENGIHDINNETIQYVIVNWLKTRLFILTMHHLISKRCDWFKEKRNYNDFQLIHIIDFVILAGVKKDIGSYQAQLAKNTKQAQIVQYFYTYCKLEGPLAIRHENEPNFIDKIDYTNCLQEERDWLDYIDKNGIFL